MALLAAGPASAGLDACAYEQGHHRAAAHADLGGGIVSYEQSFRTQNAAQAQHVIESCRSGMRLITVMADYIVGGADRSAEVRAGVAGWAKGAQASSLADVQGQFTALGLASHIVTGTKQSCACAQVYPDLRLGKERYDG